MPGVRFSAGAKDFSVLYSIQTGSGDAMKPPIQWVRGAFSPRLKRPRRETDNSPLSSAKVKNGELYIHSPPRLFGVVLN
jgi:hypothetical protein